MGGQRNALKLSMSPEERKLITFGYVDKSVQSVLVKGYAQVRQKFGRTVQNDGVGVRILSYPQMGLISALNRALSKYSSAKEKQIMEIATIRSQRKRIGYYLQGGLNMGQSNSQRQRNKQKDWWMDAHQQMGSIPICSTINGIRRRFMCNTRDWHRQV